MRFDDRTVVITGVGREGQLGEAVARAIAERGAYVALVGHAPAEVEARAAALVAARHRATAHACDLTDEGAVTTLASRLAATTDGRVDALVNLAGAFAMSGPVAESAPDLLPRQLAANLTTAYLATRAFLPLLRPARGAVLFVASVDALPTAEGAGKSAYAAAKSAVLALMRAVAAEERDAGVRANAVAPGTIRTAADLAAIGADARYVEREAVADAIVFLCSEEARGVTGQTVRVE